MVAARDSLNWVVYDKRVVGHARDFEVYHGVKLSTFVNVGPQTALASLFQTLESMADSNGRPVRIVIDCHGAPGVMILGRECVSMANLAQFGERIGKLLDRDTVVEKLPRIEILGCHVASPVPNNGARELKGMGFDLPKGLRSENGALFCMRLAMVANCYVMASSAAQEALFFGKSVSRGPGRIDDPREMSWEDYEAQYGPGGIATPGWCGPVYTFHPDGHISL